MKRALSLLTGGRMRWLLTDLSEQRRYDIPFYQGSSVQRPAFDVWSLAYPLAEGVRRTCSEAVFSPKAHGTVYKHRAEIKIGATSKTHYQRTLRRARECFSLAARTYLASVEAVKAASAEYQQMFWFRLGVPQLGGARIDQVRYAVAE